MICLDKAKTGRGRPFRIFFFAHSIIQDIIAVEPWITPFFVCGIILIGSIAFMIIGLLMHNISISSKILCYLRTRYLCDHGIYDKIISNWIYCKPRL